MNKGLTGIALRVVVFLTVCATGVFALFAVFGQARFRSEHSYRADFTNVSGLTTGQFVRIAGVEVGKITALSFKPDASIDVEFTADDSVQLTDTSRAVIRYDDLIGGRYLELQEGDVGARPMRPGDSIPVDRTAPALDLDALIGGFRPLFRALKPDQVNALASQLISALQGQGTTIGSFFTQTAALTATLADRDQLIGDVVTNLNTVLTSLSDQTGQFAKAVDSLSDLMASLADRSTEIAQWVGSANAASANIADLLAQGSAPAQKAIRETDRTAGIVVADHEYMDNLLKTLPDAYRALGRQGLTGDFFSFYLCDLLIKVNGKGGQPVYVKLASQTTGRCAPR